MLIKLKNEEQRWGICCAHQRTYYKIIAIKQGAITDRLMEQSRSLEQTSIHMETIDEREGTTIQWWKA